ncbi:MAG: CsgG/HfaB family protein [Nitrospirota bacterium]|jgi:curli biogenesis system outer membrane secretion channel CsgG
MITNQMFPRFIVAGLGLVFLAASCAPTATVRGGGGPTAAQAEAVPYTGPQKRIAVKKFTDKSAKGYRRIGDGMSEMLATALFETGRFIVLERQALRDVMEEQDLGASGRVRRETAAPIGQIEGAQLLIYGAITEFEPNYRGIGGGAALPGLRIGGLGVGVKQSYVAMDLRIVDAKTSRVVAVTKVEGKATDVGAAGAGVIGGGRTTMPLALGGWAKTPMEQAIRVCIENAVHFIVQRSF